jgi:hypothetical protein
LDRDRRLHDGNCGSSPASAREKRFSAKAVVSGPPQHDPRQGVCPAGKLSCLPSLAQEQAKPAIAPDKIEIGQAVNCDTLEEVKRYVALRGNGAETEGAPRTVNEEAHVAACGVALVMFSPGARLADTTMQGKLLSIIQIRVHAFGNGPIWTKIPATVRYTITAEKGQVV